MIQAHAACAVYTEDAQCHADFCNGMHIFWVAFPQEFPWAEPKNGNWARAIEVKKNEAPKKKKSNKRSKTNDAQYTSKYTYIKLQTSSISSCKG